MCWIGGIVTSTFAPAAPVRRFDPRWMPLIVTTVGSFMSILDSNIVNIALKTILSDFNANLGSGQFVITAYLMALAVVIPLSGFVGERVGLKRLYIITLACFTAGSLLCGLAWNLPSLILFRVIQGLGGGMLQPVGMALVFSLITPLERPKFVALLGIPALIAPIMGPSLGGYIVQFFSWRMIFWINGPIGLIDIALAVMLLRNTTRITSTKLDVKGFAYSVLAFPLLVYALGRGAEDSWTSPQAIVPLILGSVALIGFIRAEWNNPDPMLRIRLFADPLFARALAVQWIGFFSLFGLNFLLPLYLQTARGWGPAETGTVLLPMGVIAFATMNIASRQYNRIGPRPLATAGLSVLAVTTLMWTGVSQSTPIWVIVLLVCCRGVALGLFGEALQMAAYNAVPEGQIPRATALVNTGQRLTGAVSSALLSTALLVSLTMHGAPAGASIMNGTASKTLTYAAFTDAFLLMTTLSMVGIGLSWFLKDRVLIAHHARIMAPSPAAEATEVEVPSPEPARRRVRVAK